MMKRNFWIFGGLVLLCAVMAIALSQLPSNWFKPDYLVNLSSILTLISFTVRSILALRFLAIGAQLTFIPYCLLQSPPLWTPVIWNVLFLGVNFFNVVLLLLERRPVVLNADEQKLYNLVFKSLNPREFLNFLTLGEWREGEVGDTLIYPNQPNSYVSILCRGEAIAVLEGEELAKIPEGKLIGVTAVLSGDPVPVEIKLSRPSRYVSWSVLQLRHFTDKKPEIREKLRLIVSQNLNNMVRTLVDTELNKRQKAKDTRL